MKEKIKTGIAIALPVQVVLIKWIGNYPDLVETYYSNGIYPYISRLLRFLLGWIPFSVGDLLYLAFFIFVGRYFYKNWKSIRKKPLVFVKDSAVVLSIIYFAFHLLWGMNYYRQPITWKFGIEKEYTTEELLAFTEHLIERSNHYQFKIMGDSLEPVKIPYSKKEIFGKTKEGYGQLAKTYPDFEYKSPSLKSSLFSLPLSYMGYGGYLNPFSNEAQVNGISPPFKLPTTSGHEVGHQLGYSAEDTTNFIGFLVTQYNEDDYFKYTAYANSLRYCLHDLSLKDKELFNSVLQQLNPGVKKNYQEVSKFWEQYENPLEPVFKMAFNTFLKANSQTEGIKSYNSVVGLLVGYHKKYGF